jgi:hypothetical protein
VEVAEHILSRQVRVCGTIRANRGLPPDLKNESKSLKHGEKNSGERVKFFFNPGVILVLST